MKSKLKQNLILKSIMKIYKLLNVFQDLFIYINLIHLNMVLIAIVKNKQLKLKTKLAGSNRYLFFF